MREIIDYAGLFPPARLPLDTAIRNYATYRTGTAPWMLSRFIIPASMLHELAPYEEELFNQQPPFNFSVLSKAAKTVAHYNEALETALEQCSTFCHEHAGLVTTEMLEVKLPKEAASSHDVDLLKQVMDETASKMSRAQEIPATIFYEGGLDESWKKNIEAILEAISLHNHTNTFNDKTYKFAAFKLRCGGVEASLFPSTEQVAFVLNKTREYNVALKCTAGLHHPVRHYAEEVKTKMHGFFNVFGAGLLGYAHDLSHTETEEILKEEDAEQFVFTDNAFRWKDYKIAAQDIRELRETALLSYGSCSFDDPREDLRKLNLL